MRSERIQKYGNTKRDMSIQYFRWSFLLFLGFLGKFWSGNKARRFQYFIVIFVIHFFIIIIIIIILCSQLEWFISRTIASAEGHTQLKSNYDYSNVGKKKTIVLSTHMLRYLMVKARENKCSGK